MTKTFSFDVFLSHNHMDKPHIRRLARRLRDAGVKVWFDEWAIRPGDDIYLAIERGLEASRALLLCLSPAALGSDWVSMERSAVLFRDPANRGRRFLPLLLEDCELPDTLRRFKYIDYRSDTDSAFREVLGEVRPEVEEVPVPPSGRTAPAETSVRLAVLERTIRTKALHGVGELAVSPDGLWLAVASFMGMNPRLFDLGTERERRVLDGHDREVRTICITPDGAWVISGSDDRTLRVWDATGRPQVRVLAGHTRSIRKIVALADSQRILSASLDRTLRLWDVATGRCLKVFEGSDADIFSVAVTPDGRQAVSGQENGRLRLWDLDTGACLRVLTGHSATVNSVAITPDGRQAVSGSDDRTCKIWSLDAGSCRGTLEGHKGPVLCVALSPNGALIASAGAHERGARLWDFATGVCRWSAAALKAEFPLSVAFTPNGQSLVVGTKADDINVYRLSEAATAPTPPEPSRRYVNAKVVLVGESGVGKSGLAHRLIEDRFAETKSTHGRQVWRLDLPQLPDEGLEREALLWDLAGQEDYRLIHQLFLDETALALMLVNPQASDPFAEIGVWLKVLRAAVSRDSGRTVSKLLIGARCDVGAMKVSQAKIERYLTDHGFAGHLVTSALRGDNCSDTLAGGHPSALKELIAKHIPWDTLPWTNTPRLVGALKNAVTVLTEDSKVRLIRLSELAQRLELLLPAERFGEAEVRTAVTLLANQGVVMPLTFGDLVLLKPDLLDGYAGAVIRAAREHSDEIGCVAERAVVERTIDFTGVDRLEPADEDLLMRALVQTFLDKSLCIAEETSDGRHLIFPSQYRRDRQIPSHPEIYVSYSFTGEWQTVYTTLVVRLWYSHEFKRHELWRNAADFETSKGARLGLVMTPKEDGAATVSVFFDTGVPDELKWVFIQYIHRHLDKYARDVTRDRRYVCSGCGKPVIDFDMVRERLVAGKDFIFCQRCDERVPLVDHIERQLTSDPVARRVLGMDQKATEALSTQALEQILIGHMMAICGEANQIYRPVTFADVGIDGEIEFRDRDGRPSGHRLYVQLKHGDSYLRVRKGDGKTIFDVKNPRHLDYWAKQPCDVWLVIRDGGGVIHWMNVSRYLKERSDKTSRQIEFTGEKLDASAVWLRWDTFFARSG